MAINYVELAKLGRAYKIPRHKLPRLYIDELRSILKLHGHIWTHPYGRAHIYEFYIEHGEHDASMSVEISEVARIAFVGFIYRDNTSEDVSVDDVGDPLAPEHNRYKELAVEYLRSQEYEVMPYEAMKVIVYGRNLREWLIYMADEDE